MLSLVSHLCNCHSFLLPDIRTVTLTTILHAFVCPGFRELFYGICHLHHNYSVMLLGMKFVEEMAISKRKYLCNIYFAH